MLLFFQLRTIFRNRTGIEEWILDKAKYRREAKAKALQQQQIDEVVEPFIYPYDLGCIENIKQVLNLNCQPVGDGFSWKIVDGCDQFTLTVTNLVN